MVFRNLIVLAIAVLDMALLKSPMPFSAGVFLPAMLVGAVLFAWGEGGDLSVQGLKWIFFNILATVFNHVYAKSVMKSVKVPSGAFALSWYNNVLSLLPLAIGGYYLEGEVVAARIGGITSWGAWAIVASCVVGCLLSFTSYALQQRLQVASGVGRGLR